MESLRSWSDLSAVEQSLVRCGLRKMPTAGIIQAYGMALRWENASDAPLTGGYSQAEQHALVREFADAAAGLIIEGVLEIRRAPAGLPQDTDLPVALHEADSVLDDPATWMRIPDAPKSNCYWIYLPQRAQERWRHPAFFAMARTDYPTWQELGEPERTILVSAMEASGMLTGPFGIWSQPDPALTVQQRLAEVDELLAPLLPLVRDELTEVQYRTDVRSDAYTVIPLDELRSAFNGTEIWRDHEDAEFLEGAHAVFTLVGYATWHA